MGPSKSKDPKAEYDPEADDGSDMELLYKEFKEAPDAAAGVASLRQLIRGLK